MIGNLTQEEMDQLLSEQLHGHLAVSCDAEPYVVPFFYAYKDGVIYGHTYEGKKIDMMRKNPFVCVNVHSMKDLWRWESVVAWGQFEELTGQEAIRAIQLLTRRLGGAERHGEYNPEGISYDSESHFAKRGDAKVIIFGIRLTEMTGKFERESYKAS